MLTLFVGAAVALSLIMSAAWAFQRRAGNAGWVDVFWTFGLGVVGVAVALAPLPGVPGSTARQGLVALMALFWSLRLGVHLRSRVMNSPEDARYAGFRKEWGAAFQSRLFWFLQIQAAAALLLAGSMLLAAHNPRPLGVLDALGIAVLGVSVIGEGIADTQLRRFKAKAGNQGRVCDSGLWAWSRHPNYFFEWIVWFAYALMAIDPAGGFAWGWAAFAAPAFMYWLLVHVSGVPPLEAHMIRAREAAYRAYQARTSTFFPLPPR
jgi:steroid 5-alpha reductase family enzyme